MTAALDFLNPRQTRFVAAYLADPEHNGTKAAISAGYKEQAAHAQACKLLKQSHIVSALSEARQKIMAVAVFSAAQIIKELVPAATSDIRNYLDDKGRIVADLSTLPVHATKAVQSFKQTVTTIGSVETVSTEIKLWNKPEMLKLLGNHVDVQAFQERHQLSTDGLSAKMLQAFAEADATPVTIDVQASIKARLGAGLGEADSSVSDAEVSDIDPPPPGSGGSV